MSTIAKKIEDAIEYAIIGLVSILTAIITLGAYLFAAALYVFVVLFLLFTVIHFVGMLF